MANGWKYDGSGSKALAVVSCALAILAAHPIAAQALGERESGPELVAVGTVGKTTAALVATTDDLAGAPDEKRCGPREKMSRNVAGKRVGESSVSATREGMLLQLQRLGALIVKELAPAFSQGSPDHVAGLTERLEITGLREAPRSTVKFSHDDVPRALDAARAFAITHLLLAPPTTM